MPSFTEFVYEKRIRLETTPKRPSPVIPQVREDTILKSIPSISGEVRQEKFVGYYKDNSIDNNIPQTTRQKATKRRVMFVDDRVDEHYDGGKSSNKSSGMVSILRNRNPIRTSEMKRTISEEQRTRTLPSRENACLKDYLQQRKNKTIF